MENGFLNIHKPSGISSFDAVKIVLGEILGQNRPAHRVKIGHAGTLDPLADGVLVVALNAATRLIERVQAQRKTYVGTFLLGFSSPSEDTETALVRAEGAHTPSREDWEAALPEFLGEIDQVPPAYSALKIQGRKAYDLARKGRAVELEPRKITIHDLRVRECDAEKLVLEIVCGSGTYVRSLGRDLARRVGTEAVMSALTRHAVGVFRLDSALEIRPKSDPRPLGRPHCMNFLRPCGDAVPDLPRVTYRAGHLRSLQNGIPVALSELAGASVCVPDGAEFVAESEGGAFLGIVRLCADGKLRSLVNLSRLEP